MEKSCAQSPWMFTLFVSKQKTSRHQKDVRLKNDFIYDAAFRLDLESNNADCGDLVDLMKPESLREGGPSTILFFGNVTCQGQRFSGTIPLSGGASCETIGVWLRKNRGQISKSFREVFAKHSKQVSQRLLPGVPPTSAQQGRQSVLYDKSPRISSQNGCCGPSVRLLPSLYSQETPVSRKVAGWRSHIEALEVRAERIRPNTIVLG